MYCYSYTRYQRNSTEAVQIGKSAIGGTNPIRIQSMTNTKTHDTQSTVEQCIRIIEAGGEFVRITAPGINDAKNLANIKEELRKKGYETPLVADIHFNPKAAEIAAEIVEKVRINPGNYIDKKNTETNDYSELEYQAEIHKIKENLNPLLDICKQNGTAIRIGTNHGSLSNRILSKYGDTPEGMVEATLEFLRICKEANFNKVVISLKASNTRIMVYACRLLVEKMKLEQMNYPLHLGVTEAGDSEDGRIKSAVGIGALLADGIGDTIRVSLTEEPELELPVAAFIRDYFSQRNLHLEIEEFGNYPVTPFEYNRRKTNQILSLGANQPPVVILDLSFSISGNDIATRLEQIKKQSPEQYPDFVYCGKVNPPAFANTRFIYDSEIELFNTSNIDNFALYSLENYQKLEAWQNPSIKFLQINYKSLSYSTLVQIKTDSALILICESDNINSFAEQRAIICKLWNSNCLNPIILKRKYKEEKQEKFTLKSACDLGGLFIDGLADGIWLINEVENNQGNELSTSFGILQACRLRMSKTEYISCPSCGRTLFDLQKTTTIIKAKTSHLKGLKIGIMGCIVNGPGEMADADYGYVGTGTGKITLYKNKEVIKRNILEQNAVDELILLIKENGHWIEPN